MFDSSYDDFLVEPLLALTFEPLMVPRGFVLCEEQAAADAHRSNVSYILGSFYERNSEKVSGVVGKAVAELSKPSCSQVALYGSWTISVDEWVWPHVPSLAAAPNKRGYVRAMEDGLLHIICNFFFQFRFIRLVRLARHGREV